MNKKLDLYSLNDVYYSMINERKSNIMSIDTKLVTEQYQNDILVDLKCGPLHKSIKFPCL